MTSVHIGEKGPYRFQVDTGAQSSVIDSALASELGIQPQYRVELITQHGASVVTAAKLAGIRIDGRALPEVEVLFYELAEPRRLDPAIRGVVGLNALRKFNFLLRPSARRMVPAAERPPGEVVPFEWHDGRIVVQGRMGRETLPLILDSGASHVVLFRTPAAMARTPPVQANLSTLEGARSVTPTTWTADLLFGKLRLRTQPAAIVRRPGRISGLLPAAAFQQIYVDHGRRELVIVP